MLLSVFLVVLLPATRSLARPIEGDAGFDASFIRLDLKHANVTDVLKAIERQTGNHVRISGKINDSELEVFKADGEPFWTVLDRLCRATDNMYVWEAKGG
jgi:hypothetical protein